MNNSNITNEQIIQSARRQRESVNSRMGVETWHPHHRHKTFLCNTTPLCILRLSETPCIRRALSLSM